MSQCRGIYAREVFKKLAEDKKILLLKVEYLSFQKNHIQKQVQI
jgi:hypothetical protein